MNVWLIGAKTGALVTVAACIFGLAASITSLIGDLKSMGSATIFSNTFGILLRRATSSVAKGSKKGQEDCQAYRHGTDYNQRPGDIFNAILYHLLSIVILAIIIIHQTLRGLSGNSLSTLYRFVPALSGKWGLSSSAAVMMYMGLQILSYNIGKVHVTAAILLALAGLVNTVCAFVPGMSSAAGTNAHSGNSVGRPNDGDTPYDDFEGMGGSLGGGMDGDTDAPDPYDGKDPDSSASVPYDGTEGIGASAPPPGAVAGLSAIPGTTFSVPPNDMAPLHDYGQNKIGNNPNFLQANDVAAGFGGVPVSGTAQGTNEVVFDPATGRWATMYRPPTSQAVTSDATTVAATQLATNMQVPQIAMPAAAVVQPTIGYDMYGRPVMTSSPVVMPPVVTPYGAMAATQVLAPQMHLMPQHAVTPLADDTEQKRRDAKRAARREARKQFERMRDEEEEEAIREEEEEAISLNRRELRRERQFTKEAQRREKHQQDFARAEAEHDAQYRKAREAAEEEARKRHSEQVLLEKRGQAIADARQQAMHREHHIQEAEELQRVMARQRHDVVKAQVMAAAREAARLNAGPPSRRASSVPPAAAPSTRCQDQRSARRQPAEYRETFASGTTDYQSDTYTLPDTASRPASMADAEYDQYPLGPTANEPSQLLAELEHTQTRLATGGAPRSEAGNYCSGRFITPHDQRDNASAIDTSYSARAPTVKTTAYSRRKEDRASKGLLMAQVAAERQRVLAQQNFEREKESHGGSMPPYGQQRYSNPLVMPSAGQYIPPEIEALAEETIDFQAGNVCSGGGNRTRSDMSRQLYRLPTARRRAPSDQGSMRSGFSGWQTYDHYDQSHYA